MAFDSIPRGFLFQRVAISSVVSSPLKLVHDIRQCSDFLYGDAYLVAVLQPPRRVLRHTYAVRRASKNSGARKQGRALAQEFDQRWNVAYHVARIAVLHHAAVHRGFNAQPPGVRDGLWSYQTRTNRRKRVEAFSAAPLTAAFLQLPVARAHIVAAGVASNVLESVLAAHVFASFADDDHEFALVVELRGSGARGNSNGRAGILQSVCAFSEHNRIVA